MSERGPPHRSRRGRKNSSDGKVDLSHSTKRGRVQKLEGIRHRNTAVPSSPAPPTIRYSHLAGASSDPQMSVDLSSFRHHAQYNQFSEVQEVANTASKLSALASSPATVRFEASTFRTTPSPSITPSSIQISDGHSCSSHQVGNEFDYDAETSQVYQDVFSDVGAAIRMPPVAIDDNHNCGPHPPGSLPEAAQPYSSYQMKELDSPKASVGAGLLAFPARVWKSFHAELNPKFVDAVIHPSCLKKLHLVPKAIPHRRCIPPISSPIGYIHPTRFVKIAVQLSEPEVTAKTVTALVLPDQFPYYGGVCLWLGSKYIDEAHVRDWLQNYHVQHQKAVLSRQAAFTLSFGEIFADDPFYGSHHANIADDSNISQAFSLRKYCSRHIIDLFTY